MKHWVCVGVFVCFISIDFVYADDACTCTQGAPSVSGPTQDEDNEWCITTTACTNADSCEPSTEYKEITLPSGQKKKIPVKVYNGTPESVTNCYDTEAEAKRAKKKIQDQLDSNKIIPGLDGDFDQISDSEGSHK